MSCGYKYNQDNQKQALIGTIMGLMKELTYLAPHPDYPNFKGPLFIKSNSHFKIDSDHDGMLGSMIMEGILGAAFSDAVSDMCESTTQGFDLPKFNMPNIDATAVIECYSDYITEIENDEKKKHIAEHGQGTLARLSSKPLSKSFNMRAQISEAMQAFYDDLPKRMMIEKNMAHYAGQLDMLERTPAYKYATPTVAAPKPGIAA